MKSLGFSCAAPGTHNSERTNMTTKDFGPTAPATPMTPDAAARIQAATAKANGGTVPKGSFAARAARAAAKGGKR